ncbi:UNVERIFIED_CONTAM: hypothetical protein RMT77_006881 [Armadillidium vulgare]
MVSWKSYKYRFLPWIVFNLKNRKIRRVTQTAGDKIIEDEFVILQIQILLEQLLQHIPHIRNATFNFRKELHQRALQQMENVLGYYVEKGPSKVGGTGVYIKSSKSLSSFDGDVCVQRGQVVGLYPGLLYLPFQPILLQSICNKFVFRCVDGIHIDGNNKRISRLLYRSCVGRDQVDFSPVADESWLTEFPLNPLNVGQFVNNQSKEIASNVAYQEITVHADAFPLQLRRFVPNIWYSPPQGTPVQEVPLKIVSLVATKDIKVNEELFSDYFTLVE